MSAKICYFNSGDFNTQYVVWKVDNQKKKLYRIRLNNGEFIRNLDQNWNIFLII